MRLDERGVKYAKWGGGETQFVPLLVASLNIEQSRKARYARFWKIYNDIILQVSFFGIWSFIIFFTIYFYNITLVLTRERTRRGGVISPPLPSLYYIKIEV